ncbi:TetR/AcrR family transcriptional regulator [Methylobacillus arboreus]|uniref:TetR/AcrR family transcriptional regulator n=1 Tax=Methylobacillus arboreus TaxID=755170 RepID=UPI001E459F99|nr:TetR/AcrR family transcriptional regulator [Methylobacillus arboreus]MCB5191174.1 TetR/AcrR family transcriptional regulator [Methylobacillus arboreus]
MENNSIKKGRGRPSKFDPAASLETAMRLFWAHGYEGTSMADLTAAMGINKPSLYATFGSKESLFEKALEKYVSGPIAFVAAALNEPTAYRVVEKLLLESAEFLTAANSPHSCMVNMGALSCSKESEQIKNMLISRRQAFETALTARMQQAHDEGELEAGTNPATLAKYVATVHQGMSIQATSGASQESLLEVARTVLAHWPGKRAN